MKPNAILGKPTHSGSTSLSPIIAIRYNLEYTIGLMNIIRLMNERDGKK